MKAKTLLWGAFPPTTMNRHGSTAPLSVAPIPRGTEIPEDCVLHAETREALEALIAEELDRRAKRHPKGIDRKTKSMFTNATEAK